MFEKWTQMVVLPHEVKL